LLHVELDKSAGQFLFFPRRGRFAGAQAHNDILPTDRLAGVKRDVLDDPVSLVEDSEDRDTLRHRRHAPFAVRGRGGLPRGWQRRILLRLALAAGSKRERCKQ